MTSVKATLALYFGLALSASSPVFADEVPSKTPCAKLLSGKSVIIAPAESNTPVLFVKQTGKTYFMFQEPAKGEDTPGKLIRFDLKTGKKSEVELPEDLAGKSFYAQAFGEVGGQYFILNAGWKDPAGKYRNAVFLFDPNGEKFQRIRMSQRYSLLYGAATRNFTLFADRGGAKVLIYDVRSGKQIKISFDTSPVETIRIPDQDKAMFFFKNGAVRVVDYATGEIKDFKMALPKPSRIDPTAGAHFADFRTISVIDENRYFETYYDTMTPSGRNSFDTTMKQWVGDLRTGTVNEVPELSRRKSFWAINNRLVMAFGDQNENAVFDLVAMKPIRGKYGNISANSNSGWVLVNSWDEKLKKRSVGMLRPGSTEVIELPGLDDYGSYYYFLNGSAAGEGQGEYLYIVGQSDNRADTARIFRYGTADGKVEEIALPFFYRNPVFVSGDHLFANIGGQMNYLRIAEWKPVDGSSSVPSHGGAPFYEKSFRIDDYRTLELGARAGDAIDYFEREAFRAHPQWALPLLLRVLKGADITFGSLLEKFPHLTSEEFGKVLASQTYDEELIREYLPLVKKHVEALKRMAPDSSETVEAMWKSLLALKPAVMKLDETYREELSLYIARGLGNSAVGQYRGVLQAKLVKFARQAARRWLGLEYRALTDLSVVNEKGTLTPFILGVSPIDGDQATKTQFGFYAKKLEPFKIEDDGKGAAKSVDKTFSWRHRDQAYSAKYVAKPIQKNTLEFSPKLAAPDYASLWKDRALNGLVIVGDNLKSDEDMVLHEYLAYYQKQGFKFDRKTINVDDMAVFLKDEIESGRLDYMVKEAHSDGDDQNIFRYVLKAKVQVGRKTHSDGRTETVYIVDNVLSKDGAGVSGSALIPNSEFGNWIRNRDKGASGEFIFFNTSCGATVKIANEIQSAYSSTLVDIGGVSSMNTFVNDKNESGMYFVLDGIRKGKTFEEIRKDLNTCKEYLDGYDRYVFPDDDEFDKVIRQQIMLPLDVDLKILDASGKPFEIDNAPVVPADE